MAVSNPMNFFGLQDSARRDSLILMSVFVAAMLVFAWIINSVVRALAFIVNFYGAGLDPKTIQLSLISMVWAYILYKCYTRYKVINRGGGELAILFGAALSKPEVATGQEKLLHNISAEIAVASMQNNLPCYVMRNEPGINALVLGTQRQPALVVTQGVIDKLDREEMMAIVAHEYAHVANNDLNLNMRMLIVLSGLNAITEFGKKCFSRTRVSSRYTRDQNGSIIIILGFAAFLVGWVLSFFGEMIKSGFTRKRELLADAKAVQFTRDGWGLASVIDKGSTGENMPSLLSIHNGDLDHLCLLGPWGDGLVSAWLRNHPSPEARIHLLEPHFAIKKRSRNRRKTRSDINKNATQTSHFSMAPGNGLNAVSLQNVENEIAIVLSVMINRAGYNQETSQNNFNNAMRTYTNNKYRLRLNFEAGLENEFESALNTLMKQSPAQRAALVIHLQEMMEHDQISTPEEKSILMYVKEKLHPSSNAA